MPSDVAVGLSPTPSPDESGGRYARAGYRYQDLCALRYWVHAAKTGVWDEVWCETHDDIALVSRGDPTRWRLIQVKFQESAVKHWSPADLCAHPGPNKTIADSIIAKLLSKDLELPGADFRLATNEGVAESLRDFHYRWGRQEPTIDPNSHSARELSSRLSQWHCGCGGSTGHHIERFAIEQHSSDADELQAVLAQELGRLLHASGVNPLQDELDALLTKLYVTIYEVASAPKDRDPDPGRISVEQLRQIALSHITAICKHTDAVAGAIPVDELRRHLKEAGIDGGDLEYGADCRRTYAAAFRRNVSTGYGQLLEDVATAITDLCIRERLLSIHDETLAGRNLLTSMLDKIRDLHEQRDLISDGITLKICHGICFQLIAIGRLDLIRERDVT